jgi:hypothetical protein
MMSDRNTDFAWCLAVALALSIVVAATASASMVLPQFSGSAASATGDTGESIVSAEGGAAVQCKSSSDSLTVGASRNEGTATLDFSTCVLESELCNSLADAAGSILVTGEWHMVLMTKGGIDGHYFLFVVPSAGLHVECPHAAVKLLLFEGEFLGSIAQKAGSTTQFSLKVASAGKAQEFSEYENNSGTAVRVSLKVQPEGSGKPKAIFLNFEEGELVFGSATSIEK